MFLSIATSLILWSSYPIVEIKKGVPVRCGYFYSANNPDIKLKIEKYVSNEQLVITSISVETSVFNEIKEAYLVTDSVNTKNLFKNPYRKKNFFSSSANLELLDEGGLLFYELANFGGSLKLTNKNITKDFKLPNRLPRDISSAYLNCAGDLIRPDNELRPNEN